MIASVDSDAATTLAAALRHASNKPARAHAVENCVPLISASPSLGPSVMAVRPASFKASRAGMRAPARDASPSPNMAAVMCASGARSPDAPTEPCAGTTGVMPFASIACSISTVCQLMPDAPRPTDNNFSTIIKRVVGVSSGSPTPQQCDRMRLRCSFSTSCGAIFTVASLPKPVLTP